MEDVIPESEILLLPLNLSPRNGGAKAEEGGGAREVEKDQQQKISVDENEGKDGEEKGGGGGIITHLISIVSPRKSGEVPKRKGEFEVEADENSEQDAGCGAENGGGGGGVFSNIISNFNQSDGGGGEINEVEKEAEKVMKDIGNKRMKTAEEEEEEEEEGGGGGRGGIIDSIVSLLPASLPDDAAPSTDEASILLTSIVKD